MDKFSELKAAAMAATPGPWSWKLDGIFYYLSPEGVNNPLFRIIDDGSAWGEYAETIEHDGPDARFIAAANPAVILALLEELEAKDKRIAELEVEAKVWGSAATKHLARAEEAEKRLATPVRLPKRWDVSGQVNPPRIVEVQFEQQNRTLDQCADAVRAAGFTVEGGDQ